MSSSGVYRDRIYIIKDIILMLVQHGELNQTALVSFSGLNLKKHKPVLDELEGNEMIATTQKTYGKKVVTIYKPTIKGIKFCEEILEPYEKIFPRKKITGDNQKINLVLI